MTRMGSASHLGDLRRYTKGIRSSSKKSAICSDYYEEESQKECSLANQRSISLGALHQQGTAPLEPRITQLETLEAKMASIEVSLSTTPRRKKLSGSTASTPVPPNTSVQALFNGLQTTPASVTPQQDESKQDTITQGVKPTVWIKNVQQNGKGLSEKERKTAQDKLARLRADLDSKRLAIKNIKIALDTIDISDNIDVRIQQAELEYQLGREELNLLSILEESRNLQVLLEENNVQQQTIFSYIGNSVVSLYGVEIMYDPKSPQFGFNQREEGGILVEWAAETSGLAKGDRLLEVNGKLVTRQEEVCRLLNVSPSPAQVVVMRKQKTDSIMSHLQAELSVVKEKAGEAERTRDSFRRDNLRLTHRISYLEEQVAELLERARESKPKAMPQVFQKGNQVALVANLPGLEKSEGDLPHAKQKSGYDETKSTKSVDLLIDKPRRKKDLPMGRSTHSLDVEMRRQRSSDHLSGETRQRHIREARSSLFNFLDKTKYEFDSEPNLDCASENSHYQRKDKTRPIPPKKPVRLSLTRATSLQSVENTEKKSLKRTHKSEAPSVPQLTNKHKNHSKSYATELNSHLENHVNILSNGHIGNHTSNHSNQSNSYTSHQNHSSIHINGHSQYNSGYTSNNSSSQSNIHVASRQTNQHTSQGSMNHTNGNSQVSQSNGQVNIHTYNQQSNGHANSYPSNNIHGKLNGHIGNHNSQQTNHPITQTNNNYSHSPHTNGHIHIKTGISKTHNHSRTIHITQTEGKWC